MVTNRFICTMQLFVVIFIALLSNGCGSSSSSSTPPDTTAPTAPSYLTAVAASSTKVSLRWTAATDNVGVTGYAIYRDGNKLATTSTANTLYSDTNNLTSATTHTYSVTALDASGNESLHSPDATTTTIPGGYTDASPPTAPANLTASAISSSQISLSWSPSVDNTGVSGYNIYRGSTQFGAKTSVGTTITTSYTDAGLNAGTTYYYVVTAFDGVPNESDPSNGKSAETTL